MGLYTKGILGPFSGKVGTVVGSSWRGKSVLRSAPKPSSKPPTLSQLEQRGRFSFVNAFLQPLSSIITLFYGSNGNEKTRMNQAMSYHMKNAVTFVAPNFELIYNKVMISKGDLQGLQNPTVSLEGTDELRYEWLDNSGQGEALATDKLVVVVYEPINHLYFTNVNAASRSASAANITLPTYFSGFEVYSWITFVSEDNKRFATSIAMPGIEVA